MNRKIATTALVLSTIAAPFVPATLLKVAVANADHRHTEVLWAPCLNDEPEGGPCVWDGRHMGNGEGRSYLVTRAGRQIFVPHSAAHMLLDESCDRFC